MTDNIPETITEAREAEAAPARLEKHLRKLWVPFPLAGDDVYLHFGINSLARLEEHAETVMPDFQEKGFNWFGVIERKLLDGHSGTVRAVLDVGLKRKGDPYPSGGWKAVPAADIDLDDDLPWPVSEIVELAMNAIAYSWLRKTYSEMIAEVTAAREAAAEEARKAWQESKAG